MNNLSIDISALIDAAQERLLASTPCLIDYSDKKTLKNNQLPSSLGGDSINIYALWQRNTSNEKWELMYVGQRSFKSGWGRVRQHLFSTPSGTQSKLQEVRAAIESGAQVGVTAILVQPDSIRLTVEEELINRNSLSETHLLWNKKARAKVSKPRSGGRAV
ncbi:hypothetical protein [Candidatus Aalborgicola defluviihabitans]|jgi:hypothetical protein|uniref:hypothetical protein n=1 Tax=Candidatus Aalborgicola defluviihabitans TaxID=3386187 RepID=UPI001D3BEC2C|nr:hypothetical protein [Burkholderiales bacterium]MBK7314892.1 hypothetical protein [Burkholderiales bacterium]MBL0245192.1 hypothetical protein [Rhodoferax sp.]